MSTRTARVNLTLPMKLVERIDRLEPNRSRFVAEAVGIAVHWDETVGWCEDPA